MYYLNTEASFDAAHFLKDYDGKCSNIHGHRWRVLIRVQSGRLTEDGQERGMVCDFSVLKGALKSLADAFDHTFIFERGSLRPELEAMLREEGFALTEVPFRPTAENFARYFHDRMKEAGFDVTEATVYETPNNGASYGE